MVLFIVGMGADSFYFTEAVLSIRLPVNPGNFCVNCDVLCCHTQIGRFLELTGTWIMESSPLIREMRTNKPEELPFAQYH